MRRYWHSLPINLYLRSDDDAYSGIHAFFDEEIHDGKCINEKETVEIDQDTLFPVVIDRPNMEGTENTGLRLCRGPTFSTKKIIEKWPKLIFLATDGNSDHIVSDLQEECLLLDKLLVLRGVVMGNDIHFVSWIKDGNDWIFYDGMSNEWEIIAPGSLEMKRKHQQYGINTVVFEVLDLQKENENETNSMSLQDIKTDLEESFSTKQGNSKTKANKKQKLNTKVSDKMNIRRTRKSRRAKVGFTFLEKANSPKGRYPVCKGCREVIEYGGARIIYNFLHENNKWTNTWILHAKMECLQYLGKNEREQFCSKKWSTELPRKLAEKLTPKK